MRGRPRHSALFPYTTLFRSRLGPKDGFGNPYGGNLKVVGRAELLFPVPDKWRASTRISAFFDIGNVFSDRKSTRLNSSHLVISYAVFCLKKKKTTDNALPTR